mgnify:CR=1 FL=1
MSSIKKGTDRDLREILIKTEQPKPFVLKGFRLLK